MAESNPDTPLLSKIVPARGAAQKAAANLKQQNTRRRCPSTAEMATESGEVSDAADVAEDEREEVVDAPSRRKSDGVKAPRRRGRPRGRGGGISGDRQRSPVRRQPSRRSLKAPIRETPSPPNSSPLSSPPLKTPHKRSRSSTSSTPFKRAKMTASPRNIGSSSSFPNWSHPSGSHESFGDFYAEGDLVWVRINSAGDAVDPQKDIEAESYWWPAQVTGDKISEVDVKLFGDCGRGEDRVVNISTLSPSTILSFRHECAIRFSVTDFTLASSSPDVDVFGAHTSKNVKNTNITSRWKVAFDLALATDEDEELPDPLAVLNMTTSIKRTGRGKGKRDTASEDVTSTPSPEQRRKSSPMPLDEEIKVGEDDGELVLAREHKDRRDYWPAKVVGVMQDKRGNWVYEVCFMDGKRKRIGRHLFFASDEDGFATCQVGTWHTQLAPSDTEGADTEDELRDRDTSRPPSPSATDSDLEDITDCQIFGDLPLPAQMRYVYPFLCRIIRREYEPAFGRHDAFVRGGKSRDQLAQTASLRGDFSDNEMKKVSALVRRAMLRSERWAERVFDGDNVRNEERQTARTSGGTKVEPAAESAVAHSPVLEAAMALTELKSFDCDPQTSETSPFTKHNGLFTLPVESTSEIIDDSPMPPPSSLAPTYAVDESSDMEMGSDQEDGSPTAVRIPTDPVEEDKEVLATATDTEVPRDPVSLSNVSPTVHQSPETYSVPQTLQAPPSDVTVGAKIHRARPIGCTAYETLHRSERGLYCADVLLPEAVLQLHLLRAGRRTSAHLLAPKEETRLYEEGQELLQTEVPWLTQIVQLRQVAERTLKRNAKNKDTASTMVVQGGTSSRPKVLKAKAKD